MGCNAVHPLARPSRNARLPDSISRAAAPATRSRRRIRTRALPLEALLPPLYTAIDGVGELIVLHTLPGGAQPIGVALDAEEWPEVMGTIAGDDTVLIVCRSTARDGKGHQTTQSGGGPDLSLIPARRRLTGSPPIS